MRTFYKILLVLLFSVSSIFSQSISVNTDFVSRYIWRGIDLGGNVPSIQPNIKFNAGNFTLGFWGAYPIVKNAALSEIDIYASYAISLQSAGSISLGFTDYINPDNGIKFFNFSNYDSEDGPGAHNLEINLNYNGPESFPISLSANIFVHNIPNNPIYFQLGYSTSISGVALNIFAGVTPGDENKYYLTDKFDIINLGFTVSKTITITNEFSLPIFGSIILNPSQESIFYVVGISL
ncbi:MAG: hypothetical protein N2249_02800 [Melioribacter sp.]|nr:hypothetical protein [Melioribacter sp.]